MSENTYSCNKLINEASQYLRAHANNPVNWYPWAETTLELARKHDKPILLSIGYLACHWCHMMMHELFCDSEIATTMNRLFINIKVDKEERPDLDKIYQATLQILMGRAGGWPLTAFISPHTLLPYFGGTYFTKEAGVNANNVDFTSLLHRLNEIYYHDKERLQQQELRTVAILAITSQFKPPNIMPLATDVLHAAEIDIQKSFDPINTGFLEDNKFPNAPTLEFILHSKDILTRHIALTTLGHMANGGIYDQIGGGFFRYTIDPKWQIPHFEKMLSDNVQLLGLYALAYNITQHQEYYTIALETSDWLRNTLYNQEYGCFYNGLDADSDGQEGLYYLWEKQAIKELLTNSEFKQISEYYNLAQKANFANKWHIFIANPLNPPSNDMIFSVKQKLLQQRNLRSKPELDKMILTSCNGLAIINFSIASQLLKKTELLATANAIIKFIQEKLYVNGQLYATWQNNAAKITGFIDDYAFVLYGILTFINDDPQHEYLPFCTILANDLINNFYDPQGGGFYFTSKQAEKLFYRPKIFNDEATPSGNGIACLALLKLGKLINNMDYINVAKNTIVAATTPMFEMPTMYLTMCQAYVALHNL